MRVLAIITVLAVSEALRLHKHSRAKETGDNKNGNPWCVDGHLVPSVMQTGFQKAGSSSLWDQLVNKVGLKRGCGEIGKPCKVWGQDEPLYMKKELHFFDHDERYKKGMNFYAAHFPKCNEVTKFDQAIDGTPNYITDGKKVALRIKESYGDKAKDLKFVVIVRSPSKRMEAGYWHLMEGVDGDFETYIEKSMPQAKLWMKNTSLPEPSIPNPYHGSLYGKWLNEYLEVFDGSQFTVVTMEQYVKTPQKVAAFISKRINFHQKEFIAEAIHKHDREHPKMKVETSSKLLNMFEEDQKLFDELVKKHCMAMDCGSGLSYM